MPLPNIFCDIHGITEVFNKQVKNKDSFLIADLKTGQTLANSFQTRQPIDKNFILLAVSQGIGSDQLGNAASELTLLAIKDAMSRISRDIAPYDRLVAAVEEANNILWNERQNNPAMKDVMATVTAVLIENDQAFIAEVGNSRAYLIRGDQIKQLTTDQIANSKISADNLMNAEQKNSHRNLVLQAIGKAEAVKVAISMFQLCHEDILLLCASSLSKVLQIEEILGLTLALSPEKICQQLVAIASKRNASETVTAIASQFTGEALSNRKPGTTITGNVQVLSRFDPDEKVEKSHRRTLILGDASLTKKYYGSDEKSDLGDNISINSISSFPESNIIKGECESLLEHLSYCYTLLSIKPEQLQFAAKWLEKQGYKYTNLKARLKNVENGLKHIDQIRQIMQEIIKDLEDTEDLSQ